MLFTYNTRAWPGPTPLQKTKTKTKKQKTTTTTTDKKKPHDLSILDRASYYACTMTQLELMG